VEEQIGKHNYVLKLPTTVRLHHVFHVNNLRPCSTVPLRQAVPVTVRGEDDEDFDFSYIFVVCIKSLPRRRGNYLLFMTHFRDDDIPPIWHRLNEVHRTTALQDFFETLQWHKFNEIKRTSTSCTLTQRAFLSPSICFSKGAFTTEVCLAAASQHC
jgi:hypothetical protein